jgi:hypothetical protein
MKPTPALVRRIKGEEMKYLKMLGLAAIAAGALMAFAGAGTASATELTCTEPAGTKVMCPAGTKIESSSEGHAVLDSIIGKIECNSKVSGKTGNTGSSTETVSGTIEVLEFTGCTTATVHVLKKGTLEIHTQITTINDGGSPPVITEVTDGVNGNGTLTSTGAEVTVETSGFHCIFTTNATKIGTVTGSTTTKATATLDISATIPRTGGRSGAFCGASAPWTGSYSVTSPDWFDVD